MAPPTIMITEEETRLIERLAKNAFREYCPPHSGSPHTLEDLCHYGIMGLLEAKPRFKPETGVPWLAYAANRVWGAMLDAIRKQPLVAMSQNRRQKVKQLQQAVTELSRGSGERTPAELAEHLGWSIEEVFETAADTLSFIPVSETDWRGEQDDAPGEILPDGGSGPELQALRAELAELVHKCLEELPSALDRIVLQGRYLEGLKLRQLAQTLDCSEQAVQQRQKKAERQMKECIESCDWEGSGLDDLFPGG